ncbi:hypothetical protein [Tenacibaculum amylolyticum]|uniref:hypothetical protein n=1 Tax=Tenacibaculum amylolyticum TaxID=104269 RepID=UPI00389319C2
MKKVLLPIVLFLFCACGKEKEIKLLKLVKTEYDTLVFNNPEKIARANPVMYGVNVTSDSVINLIQPWFQKEGIFSDYNHATKNDSLRIYVDNSSFFHSDLHGLSNTGVPPPPMKLNESEEEYEKRIQDYSTNVKAKITHQAMLPVYIYNESNRNQSLNKPVNGGDLFLITEAKNEKGEWKPIEYFEQFTFLCGTGHQDYLLKSKQFIVAGVKKYSGSFKTKLRLKLNSFGKVFYSNTFEGSINKKQFETTELLKEIKGKFQGSTEERLKIKLEGLFVN